jgi:hypothetical protein
MVNAQNRYCWPSRSLVIFSYVLVLASACASPVLTGTNGVSTDGASTDATSDATGGASSGDTIPCELVQFADENLEDEVRVALGILNGPISSTEIARLERLEISADVPVGSLDGLECASNLEELYIAAGEVAELTPLSGLSRLQRLGVTGRVVDVTPLSTLVGLRRLGLQDNQVVVIEALANLSDLEQLGLDNNQIVDIEPLAPLVGLQKLYLSGNAVVEFGAVSELREISHLEISDNMIEDISSIANMERLSVLYARNNRISDVTPLAHLPALSLAALEFNRISEVIGLLGGAREESTFSCSDILLGGNPLTEKTIVEQLPDVCERLDGAIWWDEGDCGSEDSCLHPI